MLKASCGPKLALTLLATMPSAGFAQDASAPATPTAQLAQASPDSAEIIVTAQRRSESLSRTPFNLFTLHTAVPGDRRTFLSKRATGSEV